VSTSRARLRLSLRLRALQRLASLEGERAGILRRFPELQHTSARPSHQPPSDRQATEPSTLEVSEGVPSQHADRKPVRTSVH
jgi:hypothetical protein